MSKLSKRTVLIGAAAFLGAGLLGVGAFVMSSGPAVASIETGQQAPAFSVQDADGRTRTLSEFAGQTVILEWTNHGCPYVRKHYDAGAMQALQQEAIADGAVWLQVISSAPGEQGYLDSAGVRQRLATDSAAPTATLLDPAGVMGRAYGARVTPHMYVIDGDGLLLYQGAIDDRPSARPSSLEGATNYVRAALADMAAGRSVQVTDTTPYGCTVKYAD